MKSWHQRQRCPDALGAGHDGKAMGSRAVWDLWVADSQALSAWA